MHMGGRVYLLIPIFPIFENCLEFEVLSDLYDDEVHIKSIL